MFPSNNLMRLAALTQVLATAFLAFGVTFLLLRGPRIPDPPFKYVVRGAQIGEVCPGEEVVVDISVLVTHVPGTVLVVGTIWNTDTNVPIVMYEPTWLAVTKIGQVNRSLTILIPDLEPGEYQYRRTAAELTSASDSFEMNFVVSEDCDDDPDR